MKLSSVAKSRNIQEICAKIYKNNDGEIYVDFNEHISLDDLEIVRIKAVVDKGYLVGFIINYELDVEIENY